MGKYRFVEPYYTSTCVPDLKDTRNSDFVMRLATETIPFTNHILSYASYIMSYIIYTKTFRMKTQ